MNTSSSSSIMLMSLNCSSSVVSRTNLFVISILDWLFSFIFLLFGIAPCFGCYYDGILNGSVGVGRKGSLCLSLGFLSVRGRAFAPVRGLRLAPMINLFWNL